MYGRDLKHSFTNPGSLMNAGNVVLLMPALRDRGPGWGRLGL